MGLRGSLSFYVLLFILGGVGVLLRYVMGRWVPAFGGFPVSTLLVNVIGAFSIGFLFPLAERATVENSEWKWAVMIGLLGALTTFSSFSFETLRLLQEGVVVKALLNILLNNTLSIAFCWLGWNLSK